NGTLLNDDRCAFLRENDFLVGLSIDGPRELHDAHRVDRAGRPTFDRVMRGLRLLQKHGVATNVLVTVNRVNGDHPLRVYRFLRDEATVDWVQFIPAVERTCRGIVTHGQEGTEVSQRTVTPEQWGGFLSAVFDEWVRNDVGRVYVQTFEAAVRNWLNLPSSGMCIFDPVCGHGMALEHNGDLYACDHFVAPGFLRGNIMDRHMRELAGDESQRRFGQDKLATLPGFCRRCDVRFACHGECPKNRFAATPDGEPGLNYLCAGYKSFFTHADRSLKILAGLIRRGLPASRIMALLAQEEAPPAGTFGKTCRNAPCPCGSGLKHKKCCLRKGRQEKEESLKDLYWKRYKIRLKEPEDIEGIRRAGDLVLETLALVEAHLRPGIRTEEINTLVHDFTIQRGAIPATLNYRGYPKSVCVSPNEVICHGIPGERVLGDGDIVNVDITSILEGYYADANRTYFIGTPGADARKIVDVARECLRRAIDVVMPGRTMGDIGWALQTHAEAEGCSVVREFVGHGVGFDFHEAPQVPHYGRAGEGIKLVPGMVFTIEPMINLGRKEIRVLADQWTAVTRDGSLSAQFEQTVLVTEAGVDSLTPYDLNVLI
ncbi:MAG TPA: type I methionyl aminopeptidase, partial [Desulfosarcina sp.]|nr:type I methionyl aminopeptidase [Desulfosarcina sp.]